MRACVRMCAVFCVRACVRARATHSLVYIFSQRRRPAGLPSAFLQRPFFSPYYSPVLYSRVEDKCAENGRVFGFFRGLQESFKGSMIDLKVCRARLPFKYSLLRNVHVTFCTVLSIIGYNLIGKLYKSTLIFLSIFDRVIVHLNLCILTQKTNTVHLLLAIITRK